MEKKQYQLDYSEFLTNYKDGVTDGEHVGAVIAKMAQYFTELNLNYAIALVAYNNIAKEIEEGTDDNGKPISSAKAKVIASATNQSDQLIVAKAHLENIDTIINALKSLQKGILQEFSHMGNI